MSLHNNPASSGPEHRSGIIDFSTDQAAIADFLRPIVDQHTDSTRSVESRLSRSFVGAITTADPPANQKSSVQLLGLARMEGGQQYAVLEVLNFAVYSESSTRLSGKVGLLADGTLCFITSHQNAISYGCWNIQSSADRCEPNFLVPLCHFRSSRSQAWGSSAIILRDETDAGSTVSGVYIRNSQVKITVTLNQLDIRPGLPILGNPSAIEPPLPKVCGTMFSLLARSQGNQKPWLEVEHCGARTDINVGACISISGTTLFYPPVSADMNGTFNSFPIEIRGQNLNVSNSWPAEVASNCFLVNRFGHLFALVGSNHSKRFIEAVTGASHPSYEGTRGHSDGWMLTRAAAAVLSSKNYGALIKSWLFDVSQHDVGLFFGDESGQTTPVNSDNLDPESISVMTRIHKLCWVLKHRYNIPSALLSNVSCITFYRTRRLPNFTENVIGSGDRTTGAICLSSVGLTLDTLLHELAHVLEGNITNRLGPDMIKRWVSCGGGLGAYEKVHPSYPLDLRDLFATSRIAKVLRKFTGRPALRGKVSGRAMINPFEDVAEFTVLATLHPEKLRTLMQNSSPAPFLAKLTILKDYGFISAARYSALSSLEC